jgi:hypothetical protein
MYLLVYYLFIYSFILKKSEQAEQTVFAQLVQEAALVPAGSNGNTWVIASYPQDASRSNPLSSSYSFTAFRCSIFFSTSKPIVKRDTHSRPSKVRDFKAGLLSAAMSDLKAVLLRK